MEPDCLAETQEGPFIYSAFGDRQQQQQAAAEGIRQQEARWVAGEMGSVEIEISNPTTMQMKVCPGQRWL